MKRIFSYVMLFFTMILISGSMTVQAAYCVYDESDYLNQEEYEEISRLLKHMEEEYSIEGALVIQNYVNMDSRQYAAEFMQQNDVGYGETKEGFCFLHDPYNREIALVFRGNLQYDFDTRVQDLILDDCTEELKAGDYTGAYYDVLSEIENCMSRVTEGKKIRPMDVRGQGIGSFALFALAISFVTMAVPTLIMTLFQKGKMNMINPQLNADSYIPGDGFRLRRKSDRFIRTNVIRSAKPKDEDKGSGSSGSFRSHGESFSGSSRKY